MEASAAAIAIVPKIGTKRSRKYGDNMREAGQERAVERAIGGRAIA